MYNWDQIYVSLNVYYKFYRITIRKKLYIIYVICIYVRLNHHIKALCFLGSID